MCYNLSLPKKNHGLDQSYFVLLGPGEGSTLSEGLNIQHKAVCAMSCRPRGGKDPWGQMYPCLKASQRG